MSKQELLKELNYQLNIESNYESLANMTSDLDAKVYHNGRKELLKYIISLVKKLY